MSLVRPDSNKNKGHTERVEAQARSWAVYLHSGDATADKLAEFEVIPPDEEINKKNSMRLLMAIASAGRHYKEIVCEGDGVEALEKFVRGSKSEELLEDARDLLVTIGRGNPR